MRPSVVITSFEPSTLPLPTPPALPSLASPSAQVACGKYFEAKHKGTALIETELGGITHPNQFFEESQKFHNPDGADGTNASAGAGASSSAVKDEAGAAMAAAAAVPVA